MHASASESYERAGNGGASFGCCGASARKPWSVWEIAAMVGGFIVYWPLGLLALFLKWKNGEMWPGAANTKAPWSAFKMPRFGDFGSWPKRETSGFGFGSTGNAAFDDYRAETLRRLDEERRKLEEEGRAFRDFVEKLRRAKDQDEFDRFMAERRRATAVDPQN